MEWVLAVLQFVLKALGTVNPFAFIFILIRALWNPQLNYIKLISITRINLSYCHFTQQIKLQSYKWTDNEANALKPMGRKKTM